MDKVLFIALDALTVAPRYDAIEHVRATLLRCGIALTDARQFSNKALVLTFECWPEAALELLEALVSAGFLMDDPARERVARCLRAATPDVEVRGTLVLGFVHDEPDLSVELPAVPG